MSGVYGATKRAPAGGNMDRLAHDQEQYRARSSERSSKEPSSSRAHLSNDRCLRMPTFGQREAGAVDANATVLSADLVRSRPDATRVERGPLPRG